MIETVINFVCLGALLVACVPMGILVLLGLVGGMS